MATGFEKFKKKALEGESPIVLSSVEAARTDEKRERGVATPAKAQTQATEPAPAPAVTPAPTPGATPESASATAEAAPAKAGRRNTTKDLLTITVQVSPETKRKLDEIKFHSKKKIWEQIDQAVSDYYEKEKALW